MFEDLIKEMECLNGQSLSVPIDSDEKGYTDKQGYRPTKGFFC